MRGLALLVVSVSAVMVFGGATPADDEYDKLDKYEVVRTVPLHERLPGETYAADAKLESPTTVGVTVVSKTTCRVVYEQTLRLVRKGSASDGKSVPAELKKTIASPKTEPCEDQPAAGAVVRLRNLHTDAVLEAKTDDKGHAVLEVRDGKSPMFQGWECEESGCASPAYALVVNGQILSSVDAVAGLAASLAAKGVAQAELEKRDRAAKAEEKRQAALREQEEKKRVAEEKKEAEREAVRKKQEAEKFRQKLAVGDQTHCGMVIELKRPIVKVQTFDGEKWFRVAQLFPPGEAPCRFYNHEYVDPEVTRP